MLDVAYATGLCASELVGATLGDIRGDGLTPLTRLVLGPIPAEAAARRHADRLAPGPHPESATF
jgi:integrase